MAEKKIRVILFVRVSSEKQSYERQIEDTKNAAKILGYSEDECISIEDKESATKNAMDERHGISKLTKALELNKNIEIVIATEISRISRRQIDALMIIKDITEKRKIKLYLTQNGLCSHDNNMKLNPSFQMIMSILTNFAEMEGKQRMERTMSGLKQKLKQGSYPFGVPFGYSKDKDGKPVVNEEQATLVRKIYRMYIDGLTVIKIWREVRQQYTELSNCGDVKLNTGQSKIHTILTNPLYKGQQKATVFHEEQGTETVEFCGQWPPIVTDEMWEQVRQMRDKNNTKKGGTGSVNSQTKYIYYCQGKLVFERNGKQYVMRPKAKYSYMAIVSDNDKSKYYLVSIAKVDYLAQFVLAQNLPFLLQQKHKDLSKLAKERNEELEKEKQQLEESLANCQDKMNRCSSVYVEGNLTIEAYNEKIKTIKEDIDYYNMKLKSIEQQMVGNGNMIDTAEENAETRKFVKEFLEMERFYHNLLDSDNKPLLRELIYNYFESIVCRLVSETEKDKHFVLEYKMKGLEDEPIHVDYCVQNGKAAKLYLGGLDISNDFPEDFKLFKMHTI